MKVNVTEFSKPCNCGKEHSIFVKEILIEEGAVKKLPDLFADGILASFHAIGMVCDEHTYEAAGKDIVELLPLKKIIQFSSCHLHADNRAIALVREEWDSSVDILLAVGSGTIHDITRFIAKEKEIPFVSIPTAASVDGFVSTVAAMTWNGLKNTMEAVSPIAVIADSAIFSKAPYRLTASGISDLMGKYIALADWKIAHLLTGEYYCERVVELEQKALQEVDQCLYDLKSDSIDAYEKLMHALLLSGLAMQMVGNSRPASGAEHHIAHLWEMEVLNETLDAYHGEKVSIGVILCIREYKKIQKAIQNKTLSLLNYTGFENELLKKTFGKKGLLKGILQENEQDLLMPISSQIIMEQLPDIEKTLEELPQPDLLEERLKTAGCLTDCTQIGIKPERIPLTLQLAPYVRRRLTLLRLEKRINL